MQTNQSYLSEFRETVKHNYRHFFALDDNSNEQMRIPQMPDFQIQLYLKQALADNFPVRIQFNNQTTDAVGRLKKLSEERYLVTSGDAHLTRILNVLEIQAIQKLPQKV